MHKRFRALPILVAILAFSASTAAAKPAPIRTLHAGLVSKTGVLVGQADATTVAYRSGRYAAPIILRSDDRVVRTVAAPDGCVLTAAGSGLLAGECGERSSDSVEHLAVTRLDGTVVTRLDARSDDDLANGFSAGGPVEVGTQWIRASNSMKDGGNWWQDVNWHTGEVRQSTEDDARQVDDLDAAGLYEGLCAPLRRGSDGAPDLGMSPGYYAATVDGPWALIERRGTEQNTTFFMLQHCGLARPVRLPAHFSPIALGHGWVAGMTAIAGHGPRFDVIRLADRRRYAVRSIGGDPSRAVFTSGRVYVTTPAGLSTARLPQK